MGVTAKWRSGVASDAGRIRTHNEDRYYVDDEHGIFVVVDGVGGHAGGETAAELAVEAIQSELAHVKGDLPDRIRRAITAANNQIYARGCEEDELRGMACVLTLAVVEDDVVTLGHVGDSRLYLLWNGAIRKLTSDHSPVGEKQDRGELSEEEAMLHPRRHEVFRDVGSHPREPGEPEFIEIREFMLKPDAAILLASDGLSDVLTMAEIRTIVERYDGDPERTARDLVEAANQAGGTDNVTAIFVASSDFLGHSSAIMSQARERHAITRAKPGSARVRSFVTQLLTGRLAFLLYGLLLGLLLALRFR